MSVTACLITRNHDRSIERAVRSVGGLASEVVVADTGSTDRTVAVAEGLGARVVPIEWADDFSAACNAAIDRASGEWVLVLNPDEELDPAGVPVLTAAVGRHEVFAYRLRVRQQLRPDNREYGTADRDTRLFRRDPRLRYVRRLHPVFDPPLAGIAASRNQVIATVEATIYRHAYLSAPTPDKIRWAVRLLEAELRDRPGQLPLRIELGRNLLFLNDPRGHEVLGEVAARVKAVASAPAPPDPMVGQLLEYLLAVSPEQSRSPIARDEARQLAARWFPNTPPVVWAVAAERFGAKDYQTAAGLLGRLVNMGRTGRYDPAGGFAPGIIGPAAQMNLGMCYLHLGRWDEAKACFGGLLNDPAHRERAAQGFALADRRERPAG